MDRLTRRFIHFEAEPEPIVEPAEPPAEPEPAPEPAEPQGWQGVSESDWQETQQLLGAMAQAMSEPQPQHEQQQQPELPDYDPFDPNSVQQYVSTLAQQQAQEIMQQTLGPLEPLLGHIAESEGEKLAREALSEHASEIGEFDQDQAVLLAQGLLQQGYEADQALRLAAERTHAFEEGIRAKEREAYKQHLETLNSAPTPTPAGGAAAGELDEVPTGSERYRIAVNRALGINHPVHPTG